MTTRLNGRTLRRTHTFDVTLTEGVVTLRRLDLLNQWLLGKSEHALVSQVYATERVFAKVDPKVETLKALEELSVEDRLALLEGLRRFATLAMVSPRATLIDDGDPDAIPVEILSFADLMSIWNARPPVDVVVDPDQPIAVPVQEDGASRFPPPAADAESSESARDYPAGTLGDGAAVALPAERAPYPGLVSLTTH